MKTGQLIKYNMRIIFENHSQNVVEKLLPDISGHFPQNLMLTRFIPLVSFYTPENIRKPEVLTFAEGIERDH